MDRKLIIQISIIVVAFGAAGIIFYNGFVKTNRVAVPAETATSAVVVDQQTVLPYGPGLDFSLLHNQNQQYNIVTYPKLDPSQQVGVPLGNLIVPPPSQ